MAIGEICTREVVVAKRDITVKSAAQLMREYHVGCIVLVDEQGGKRQTGKVLIVKSDREDFYF